MLIADKRFQLPGKKALLSETSYEAVLVDATESPVKRPKSNDAYYPGKKKRHTLKTQLVADKNTRQIICTAHANGRRHDFRLFKDSKAIDLFANLKSLHFLAAQ